MAFMNTVTAVMALSHGHRVGFASDTRRAQAEILLRAFVGDDASSSPSTSREAFALLTELLRLDEPEAAIEDGWEG